VRSDEILTSVRFDAFIGDATAFSEYTDARLLAECNDKLMTVFGDIVVKARSGYWLKDTIMATSSTRSRYRIPYRAVAGGLEKVEISDSVNGPWCKLTEVTASQSAPYEGASTTKRRPIVYTVQGDQVELLPAPDAVYQLRLSYYVRPSRLVPQQSSTLGGGTVRGLITAVDTTLRTLTTAVLPFDQELAAPAAISSGVQRIDVVHPNGWHELALVNTTQTIAGVGPFTFTVGGTDDMSDIEVGDFIRVAEQTDWPCLPDDFHRCLADIVAVKIMVEMNMAEKSATLADNVQADMLRFRSLLTPRVKAEPPVVPLTLGGNTYAWGLR